MVMRFLTALGLAMLLSPRNPISRLDSFGRLRAASERLATSCMSDSAVTCSLVPAPNFLVIALLPLGPVAFGASFGSSVQGCTTRSGLSDLMISPVPLRAFAVANPEMWSRCRCVATTAWSLPPVLCLMSSAISIMHAFGEAGRAKIDEHVPFGFSRVLETDEKAITESDVVSADCRTGGRLRHFSVLSDQTATVELGEVRLRTRWWSELRPRTWGRAWRKRFVEEALFPQVIEPRLLPFGIFKSVRDLIFELPVLVEDESSSAKDPDSASRIDSLRRNEAELLLQFVGLKRQDLNVFSHGFMQHKTVGTDPDRRTNRLDLDVAVGVDFKHLAIFPYESEHLLRLVQHRIVVAPAIDQLLVAPLPGAVDIGFAGLLNAIIVEIFEQRLAIAVLLIVRNNFAVDGKKRR